VIRSVRVTRGGLAAVCPSWQVLFDRGLQEGRLRSILVETQPCNKTDSRSRQADDCSTSSCRPSSALQPALRRRLVRRCAIIRRAQSARYASSPVAAWRATRRRSRILRIDEVQPLRLAPDSLGPSAAISCSSFSPRCRRLVVRVLALFEPLEPLSKLPVDRNRYGPSVNSRVSIASRRSAALSPGVGQVAERPADPSRWCRQEVPGRSHEGCVLFDQLPRLRRHLAVDVPAPPLTPPDVRCRFRRASCRNADVLKAGIRRHGPPKASPNS